MKEPTNSGRRNNGNNLLQYLYPLFSLVIFAAPMVEKLDDIITRIDKLFLRCGIKSVSMDDVARELKISKKTLYRFVKDKQDLVCKVMSAHCACNQQEVEKISTNNTNAVDELLEITEFFALQLRLMHPSIHYDLEKYYPDAWNIFNKEHKEKHIQETILSNLKKGIKAGLYRKDFNVNIITKLFVANIDVIFDPTVFPPEEYRFSDVHREKALYHIRGIATSKGQQYLEKRIKQGILK